MLRTAVLNNKKSKPIKNVEKKCKDKTHCVKPIYKHSRNLPGKDRGNEIEELQKIVFGGADDLLEKWKTKESKENKKDGNSKIKASSKRKPAWEDEDDEQIIGNVKKSKSDLLKAKFNKTCGDCSWADLDRKKTDSDDDELMQKTGNFLGSEQSLPKSNLEFKECKDLNFENKMKGRITSIQFHSYSQVALVGSRSRRVQLFQVDGKNNPLIQSIYFDGFPVSYAQFSSDGREILAVSHFYGFMYYYDMISGKIVKTPRSKAPDAPKHLEFFKVSPDNRFIVIPSHSGYLHLHEARTKEWISSLKMNSHVTSFDFNKDGTILYSCGENSEVYLWDMRSRKLQHKFCDDGCITGTAIACSPNNQYLACGSDSGIVNIYNTSSCEMSENPKPLKIISNLTTQITNLKFNSTSEILGLSSIEKKSAVKLFHCRSMSVFKNFPELNSNILWPTCLDFSPNSGYFSVTNTKGRAALYRLMQYNSF